MEPANRQSPPRNLNINNNGQKNTQEFNPSPTNFFQAKEEKPASDGSYFSLSELANSLLSGGNKPDQKRMFHKRLEQFMEKAYNGDICGSDIGEAIRLLSRLTESGKLTNAGTTAVQESMAELGMLLESLTRAEEKKNQAEQKPNSDHPPAEKKDDSRSFANRSTNTLRWRKGLVEENNKNTGSNHQEIKTEEKKPQENVSTKPKCNNLIKVDGDTHIIIAAPVATPHGTFYPTQEDGMNQSNSGVTLHITITSLNLDTGKQNTRPIGHLHYTSDTPHLNSGPTTLKEYVHQLRESFGSLSNVRITLKNGQKIYYISSQEPISLAIEFNKESVAMVECNMPVEFSNIKELMELDQTLSNEQRANLGLTFRNP